MGSNIIDHRMANRYSIYMIVMSDIALRGWQSSQCLADRHRRNQAALRLNA
jgi:hypothetical protein